MKNKPKNFIAFTLSEMMVVLLIVSVLSAATLPAITKKKTENPKQINPIWQSDSTFDLGHYFVGATGNANAEVHIGADTHNLTSTQVATEIANNGAAALKLRRPNASEIISNGGPYANYGNSDIVFYNQENKIAGKLAADQRGNIAIGLDAAKQIYGTTLQNMYGNFFLGHYAGSQMINGNLSYSQYNTIVGNNALRRGYYRSGNVVIGQEITDAKLGDYNVNIGNNAGSYSNCNAINNNILIGSYSSYSRCNLKEAVNIGYYSGAMPSAVVPSSGSGGLPVIHYYAAPNMISLGAYAGYYAGFTDAFEVLEAYQGTYSSLNLGYYAGAFQYSTYAGIPFSMRDALNVGYYSGYKSTTPINIGSYAGALRSGFGGALNIGSYAGAETGSSSNENINIGRYAGYGYKGARTQLAVSPNGMDVSVITKMINIGNYAGALSYDTENAINIGYYAGYNLVYSASGSGAMAAYSLSTNYNINIGYAAGMWRDSGTVKLEGSSSIHIGDTGAYGTNYNQVIIGCYGHSIKAPYRMCIGGQYPASNSWITGNGNVFKPSNTSTTYASTLILPPGINHLSDSGWSKTAIWLLAYNIVSFKSSLSTFSDRTLKENIKPTTDGIKNVRKLNIREFNIKGDKRPSVGVIAQELKEIYPNLVKLVKAPNGKEYYAVKYDRFVYSLAQAVKDVDNIALGLQTEVNDNMQLIAKLSSRILLIEDKLNKLSISNKRLNEQLKEIDVIISKTERK